MRRQSTVDTTGVGNWNKHSDRCFHAICVRWTTKDNFLRCREKHHGQVHKLEQVMDNYGDYEERLALTRTSSTPRAEFQLTCIFERTSQLALNRSWVALKSSQPVKYNSMVRSAETIKWTFKRRRRQASSKFYYVTSTPAARPTSRIWSWWPQRSCIGGVSGVSRTLKATTPVRFCGLGAC